MIFTSLSLASSQDFLSKFSEANLANWDTFSALCLVEEHLDRTDLFLLCEDKLCRNQVNSISNSNISLTKAILGETERDCRENVSQSNQFLNKEFEIVTSAGNRMIHADTWVMWSKTCSRDWLTRYFLLYLGIYVDLNIGFLLSSAVIQFLEVGYLF